MSEQALNTIKTKKWDEVNGITEDTKKIPVAEGITDVGTSPSISRNYMRGIEDMVEQNDNNFDGVINNVEIPKSIGAKDMTEKEKQSILEKLKGEKVPQASVPSSGKNRKPIVNCCLEREIL